MSSVNDSWNPDDGPPPTDEERAQARELADALAHGRRPAEPELDALLNTALRVRATAHPDDARAEEVARRAVRGALDQDRPGARVLRLRWRVVVGVAAAGVVAFAVGVGLRDDDRAPSRLAADLPPAFTEAVQPGAGAAPATRLYDRRLRLYREGYLRRGSR